MKGRILKQLNQTSDPISGEKLSRELGVSRVAVWKHIRQMQQLGYHIKTTGKGYCLSSEPDNPFPWAFGERAPLVHYFPEVTSTMDEAAAFARKGCPEYSVVVAERQTKGRGRLQRVWQSELGGLYFTMILRPKVPPTESPLINLAAALDLAHALKALYAIETQLKWPNDVLVEGRKLAGILSQMAAEADRIDFVNLGVGINVHNDTRGVEPPAVSVAQLTARPVSRANLLIEFWDRLQRRLDQGLSGVVAEWKSQAVTLGRQVVVRTLTDTFEGKAIDLQEHGGLILETADGERKTIFYGDCFQPSM